MNVLTSALDFTIILFHWPSELTLQGLVPWADEKYGGEGEKIKIIDWYAYIYFHRTVVNY